MKKDIIVQLDEEIYDRLKVAVELSKDTESEAVESGIRWYISTVFQKLASDTKPVLSFDTNSSDMYYGKAIKKIPKWAMKPEQYNHKIIKAYYKAIDIAGEATINMMERLCSDPEFPELYVSTFKNNYSQMKADGSNTHGKVFEDNGYNVWIWDEVEEVLNKYKEFFYKEEPTE